MSAMGQYGGSATGMSLFGTALFTWRSTPAWIVLLAGLLLTALFSIGLAEQRARSADHEFELHVTELLGDIEKRLHDHEQILLGGAGLFDVNGMVTRAQWRTYVERLALKARYPGIQGVGFSQLIPPDALTAHIAAMRAAGFADYTVRPEGERALYTSIVYLEPFMGRNLAAFGFDMFSEATRRQAMQRAVDNNTTAISGRVKLVQETHGKEQAGFLMYLPVYRQGMPLNSVEARWQALHGFVYSPYRMDDLMQGILGGRDRVVDFTLHNGESTLADSLMYDSAADHAEEYAVPPSHQSLRRIDAFGQIWTLSLRSRPAFQAQYASATDGLIPGLGSGISVLLFALILALLGRREQALARAAELAVRKTEKFLNDVLDAASEVSIIATDRNGLITVFNRGAEQLLGYASAEMVGKQTPAILHQIDEVVARGQELGAELGRPVEGFRIFVEMPERHGSEKREWTYLHKDSHAIPVALVVTPMRAGSGEILGYLGIAEDISERKRGEMSLQDQARYTQAILDNVIDGIITIDERGTVASLNQAAERIFGYPPGEVLGQNIKMLMPEPYHSEHDGYLANYRATGVERVIGIGREVVGRRKDGRSFPMDLAVSEISHAGRRMFVGLVRDITERKRVEQMKSEFVSTVSHELRTPLTSISGALGLINGGAVGELPPSMKPLIDIAHNNSLRLIHLINDLLDMEKIAAGKMHFDMQLLALLPLVEQALEANKAYGEARRVRFALTERVESLEVRIDSQRLQQVMANFLSNAAKFSPEGGQVEVAVQRRGDRVRVSVRDYGPGIPDAFRSRIFEKFSQADASDTRQKGGTGLGLAISRELIERMGGAVGYDSVLGEGATFWIELPIDKHSVDPAVDPAGPASVRETLTDNSAENPAAPRILVVEDDPDIAYLLQLMLTRAGYRSAVAASGEQALTLLADGDFAAMTLDLLLPGMSGLDVISRVRQNPATTELPIVVVSATVEDGRLAIDGDFSTLDWLPKPLDEARLQLALERALPRARSDQPQRVLHVEDDVGLHQVIRAMVGNRYIFEHAASLSDARTRLAMQHYDVVILDLTLPDGSGWELLALIRAQRPEPLVIILSGTELSHAEAGKVEAALLKSHVSPRALLDALNSRITKSKESAK